MTEQNHPEKQQEKTPQELNQDLRTIYDLLPNFNIFYAEEEIYQIDHVGNLIDTRSDEQYWADLNNLEENLKRRKRSEMSPILQARLHGLLEQSHLVPSARTYVEREFDQIAAEGLEHEDYPNQLPFKTKLQFYTRLFKWKDPDNGGIFDTEQAQDIDRSLYRMAVNGILSRQRTDELLAEDEEIQDLLSRVRETIKTTEEKIKTMTPEELAEYNAKKVKEDEAAHETLRKLKDEEALVKVWRNEYKTRYGDEP